MAPTKNTKKGKSTPNPVVAKEIHKTRSKRRRLHKYNHRMSRKGYANLEQEMEKMKKVVRERELAVSGVDDVLTKVLDKNGEENEEAEDGIQLEAERNEVEIVEEKGVQNDLGYLKWKLAIRVPLAKESARVSITRVVQGFAEIPFTLQDEIKTVEEAIGTYIAWLRDLILEIEINGAPLVPPKKGQKKNSGKSGRMLRTELSARAVLARARAVLARARAVLARARAVLARARAGWTEVQCARAGIARSHARSNSENPDSILKLIFCTSIRLGLLYKDSFKMFFITETKEKTARRTRSKNSTKEKKSLFLLVIL
ncbi:hypothetical protein AgCh_040136 [Apium graveolens]